ncbi:hypothetical protein CDL15_Pgr002615 [Punica granatum]|uniref:Germin-like protein n=1 Tax=Punica granatum TaxID=22663 RepID=A0A218W3D6_PUNGR|nr:hypothetical protein CDL15_Pgr002615 [Punica granatum]
MKLFVVLLVWAFAISSSFASDPSPLQDICVAIKEPKDAVFVNGKFCKNPNLTVADDFFFQGLNIPRSTDNKIGSSITGVDVSTLPGVNTLGVSLVRIDYAPNGTNPPHFHPRASEILMCMEGELYVGFVSSNMLGNRFFTKVLKPGDLFVFPLAMIHFQLNIGKTPAIAFAIFDSQNPGLVTVGNAVFGANPPIDPQVLIKALQLDKKTIDYLQSRSWYNNHD